ncbi:6-phospho-3-hexuloisomerase [Gracilibacillus sp. YIM 98692]|uniref:6-phospho-3-hexuloisomerase n=1 Tax=Gracilibacillus sp. YIM 98692 TaxID=2663532 RepID=UPI0013D698CC|nr:6-phospho-3-hexuloisomerase [Gracilibacillus sp. YIM 98692]
MVKMDQRVEIVDEAKKAFLSVNEKDIEEFAKHIQQARKIFIYGLGRERLMLQAFAMRLMHLGFEVHMVGDVTTPKITEEDLFITSSGTGYLSTVKALLNVVKESKAEVVYMTADKDSPLTEFASQMIVIQAQTMKDAIDSRQSLQPMGAVFEQAQLFLFEWLIIWLKDKVNISDETMEQYHTNLE